MSVYLWLSHLKPTLSYICSAIFIAFGIKWIHSFVFLFFQDMNTHDQSIKTILQRIWVILLCTITTIKTIHLVNFHVNHMISRFGWESPIQLGKAVTPFLNTLIIGICRHLLLNTVFFYLLMEFSALIFYISIGKPKINDSFEL